MLVEALEHPVGVAAPFPLTPLSKDVLRSQHGLRQPRAVLTQLVLGKAVSAASEFYRLTRKYHCTVTARNSLGDIKSLQDIIHLSS